MPTYGVDIGAEPGDVLVSLPAELEQAVRQCLATIALAYGNTLPEGSAWTRPLGVGPRRFHFELGGFRFVYELDQARRRVRLVDVWPSPVPEEAPLEEPGWGEASLQATLQAMQRPN